MVYYEMLRPCYARQKDFYNKAKILVEDNKDTKTLTLFSDNLKDAFVKVAKITIDKKHQSKNRYYITNNKNYLDALTLKHIYDFIFQYYVHKTTKSKLLRRGVFQKNNVFKYALQLD